MLIDFSPENKSKNSFDYPKLMLEKDEKARIACIEQQPTAGYTHTLKGPQIMNGEPVFKNVRQKDGSYKDEMQMDFVGRHMCFGNVNKLQKDGKDPANCPTCAKNNETDHIWGAQRAFAMHIIRYEIQPGSFKPQNPFQIKLIAWRFSNKVFDSLVDIMEEHGDLRKKDLNLGPCINKMYQNYDINVGSDALWASTEEYRAMVKSIYAENKSEDLSPMIARKISRELAQEDIDKVLHRWAVIEGDSSSGGSDAAAGGAAAQMDLDTLLSDSGDTKVAAPAADLPEPTESGSSPAWDPEPTPEPEAVPAPAAEKKSEPLDFDSLLEGL